MSASQKRFETGASDLGVSDDAKRRGIPLLSGLVFLGMMLFSQSVFAEEGAGADFKSYDPMEKAVNAARRVEIREKTEKEKETGDGYVYMMKEDEVDAVIEISPEAVDPLKKLEKITFVKSPVYSNDESEEGISLKSGNGQSEGKKAKKESEYAEFLAGYPMEDMVPYLEKENPEVAAFLVAIAKKESDWGKHSPKMNGNECHNYWGYKGVYNPTESGYSCFDSPEQAVSIVGERIGELIDKNIDTPEKMVVWKCGSSCKGHDPDGVKKWISDVGAYYDKVNS